MENAYTKSAADALQQFGVTEAKGLSVQQVESARQKYGRNGTFLAATNEPTAQQLMPAQHCQRTPLRPSGSSSWSSSRTSWY